MTAVAPAIDQPQWVTGDRTGMPLPATAEALVDGGAAWLTRAFHAMGSLERDNRVIAIRSSRPFVAGGTGAKQMLKVEYDQPGPGLFEDIFVKFSRNYGELSNDNARHHMEPEVRFAALSRTPGFPVTVAECLFADFEHASGTGLMITRAIPFGQDGIEPQYGKCLDHEMPEPLEHYRTLVTALARLAGSFKAGKLPTYVAAEFPFDHARALATDRLRHDDRQLGNRVNRYRDFALAHPRLLPEAIRSEAFFASLLDGALAFRAHEDAIKAFLHDRPDMIALCHWNANSDNAWYWRDADGALHCGLLDWGSVGQMPLSMALWGCLSSAEGWLWRDHLGELLALFASEYAAAGGPLLLVADLREHLLFKTAAMGLLWLTDAPPRILREVPDLADCADRFDPRILASETARVQLQMMVNFLSFWQAEDLTKRLRVRFG
jgi:hypothetical protein